MTSQFCRCPSCGFDLAPYRKFFNLARECVYEENIMKNYKEYSPEKMIFIPDAAPPLEDLLNGLNIKNICCRSRLIGEMYFDKLYR